jgi:hypothetical protein
MVVKYGTGVERIDNRGGGGGGDGEGNGVVGGCGAEIAELQVHVD